MRTHEKRARARKSELLRTTSSVWTTLEDAPRWALTSERQKVKLRWNGSAYAIANYNAKMR